MDFDQSSASTGLDGAVRALGTETGRGVRVAGGVDLLVGLFVDGEFTFSSPNVDANLLLNGDDIREAFDADSRSWRLSAGYKFELIDIVAAYGQVGYTRRTFDPDTIALETPGGEASFNVADLEAKEGGLEAELGLRAEVLPRLELTGALRFTEAGILNIPSTSDITSLDFDEGVFGQVGAIISAFGPAAVRVTYEMGDTQTAFIGLRAQF